MRRPQRADQPLKRPIQRLKGPFQRLNGPMRRSKRTDSGAESVHAESKGTDSRTEWIAAVLERGDSAAEQLFREPTLGPVFLGAPAVGPPTLSPEE
jgi:hypothetical protein